MAWYRKTTPESYPGTAASNFTDSSKHWRQYKNMYRFTSGTETASLTAIPGRYTDSTRTWRRINSVYRFTSSGTWQKIFGKFAGQPYPLTAAAIRYNSYDGTDVGTYAMMGPGSESIAQGATGITYLWGKDAQNWQNIQNLSSRNRSFFWNTIPVEGGAYAITDDEGNWDGDKLRNVSGIIDNYDGNYIWYRDQVTLTNGSTGSSYSQAVRVIKQQPVINSLAFKTNSIVSAGSTKYITFSVKNEWYRDVDRYNSVFNWYILDTQYATPSASNLLGTTHLSSITGTTDNTTTFAGEDYFAIPETFNGSSTANKWLYIELVCKNSGADSDLDSSIAPYSNVTDYIEAQIGAASATAPTSVSATSTTTYFDVTWSGATNATIYRVFWIGGSSTTADPAVSYDYETTSTTWRFGTSYPDRNGLTPSSGSSYYFYVSASSGNGVWTPYVRSTTSYSLQVVNATSPTSISLSATADTITVNWSGATNAAKYRIYWSAGATNSTDPAISFDEEKVVDDITITSGSGAWGWGPLDKDKNGNSPTLGDSYYFYISASNTNNVWSPWARSSGTQSLLAPPVNQTAPTISGSNRTFTLTSNGTWNPDDSDGVYQYQWKYNDQGSLWLNVSASYSTTGNANGASLSLNTSALDGLGIRCYVTATNGGGSTTAYSNQIVASAPTLTAPSITSVSWPTTSGGPITVNFTGGSGPYYQIFWMTGSDFTNTSGYDANGGSSPITDLTGPVSNNTTYYVAVRSVSSLTNTGVGPSATISAWSPTSSATTSFIIPKPTGGSAYISGTAKVGQTISGSTSGWTDSPTSYDLRIVRGTAGVIVSETTVATSSTSSVSYTIPSGDVGFYYKVFAKGINSGGTADTWASSSEIGPVTAAAVVPSITSESISPSSGTAGSTTFTASATITGTPTPTVTYQWQYFSTSYTFVDISGATSSTYKPPSNFNTAYPNYGFYCLITATSTAGTASARPSATLNSPTTTTTTTTTSTACVCAYVDQGTYYYSPQCCSAGASTTGLPAQYLPVGSCCPNITKTTTTTTTTTTTQSLVYWKCNSADVANSSNPCAYVGQCKYDGNTYYSPGCVPN